MALEDTLFILEVPVLKPSFLVDFQLLRLSTGGYPTVQVHRTPAAFIRAPPPRELSQVVGAEKRRRTSRGCLGMGLN